MGRAADTGNNARFEAFHLAFIHLFVPMSSVFVKDTEEKLYALP